MITEAEHWRTIDDKGVTMPWYTRACCAWLEGLDLKGKKVFEYGGGQSTHWFRSRGAVVEGVDSNPEWAQMAGLELQTEESKYLKSIHKYDLFDFVCIDGIWRDQCFYYGLEHMTDDGTIIIDNWMQPSAGFQDWPETESWIKGLNLKLTVFPEPTHVDWKTAIITR